MSEQGGDPTISYEPIAPRPPRSFVHYAKVIGGITLISRVLGLARESVTAHTFGASPTWSAFVFAFKIPNLFRKLLGEGALSAAFIPLYATQRKGRAEEAFRFAAASVNLLALILFGITLIGEAVIWFIAWKTDRPDYLLAAKFTAVMLPYVMLVCGAAFLGGILQVHERFAATAATSIVLNAVHIATVVFASTRLNLRDPEQQVTALYWLSIGVVVSGVLQVLILVPSLRSIGFKLDLIAPLRTPAVKTMLLRSLPVALGAGVLQIGVLMDSAIAFALASDGTATHFTLFGHSIAYPMSPGAAARLDRAQYLYQFPLGVFAIALATAMFPRLSADAGDRRGLGKGDHSAAATPQFKSVLRRGVEASLFIGLPASVGMILVAGPVARLVLESGATTRFDSDWTARSTMWYSAGIWAFSLQQILSRAYYALHDTITPLVWTIVNLAINLAVELPLLFTPLHESAMAVGTLASFSVQSLVMLWMLDRRAGGLGLAASVRPVFKMLMGTAVMTAACLAIRHTPLWTTTDSKRADAIRLGVTVVVGGATYLGAAYAMGLRDPRKKPASSAV